MEDFYAQYFESIGDSDNYLERVQEEQNQRLIRLKKEISRHGRIVRQNGVVSIRNGNEITLEDAFGKAPQEQG